MKVVTTKTSLRSEHPRYCQTWLQTVSKIVPLSRVKVPFMKVYAIGCLFSMYRNAIDGSKNIFANSQSNQHVAFMKNDVSENFCLGWQSSSSHHCVREKKVHAWKWRVDVTLISLRLWILWSEGVISCSRVIHIPVVGAVGKSSIIRPVRKKNISDSVTPYDIVVISLSFFPFHEIDTNVSASFINNIALHHSIDIDILERIQFAFSPFISSMTILCEMLVNIISLITLSVLRHKPCHTVRQLLLEHWQSTVSQSVRFEQDANFFAFAQILLEIHPLRMSSFPNWRSSMPNVAFFLKIRIWFMSHCFWLPSCTSKCARHLYADRSQGHDWLPNNTRKIRPTASRVLTRKTFDRERRPHKSSSLKNTRGSPEWTRTDAVLPTIINSRWDHQ